MGRKLSPPQGGPPGGPSTVRLSARRTTASVQDRGDMEQPLAIYRASTTRDAGRSGATMRRRAAGDGPDRLVRVGPNAFVRGADWDAAGPRQRYVTRVFARLGRRSAAAAGSHVSAVAAHGLPWLYPWPDTVHVTVPKSQYRSGSESLKLHTRPFVADDVVEHAGVRFTSVARTVADVALLGDVRAAVVVADAALRRGLTRQQIVRAVGGDRPRQRTRDSIAGPRPRGRPVRITGGVVHPCGLP
jgi:hypothetical protein